MRSDEPLTVADKLAEARKLIERGWTQGAYTRNAAGDDLEDVDWEFTDTKAVCWCMAGAMGEVGLKDEADAFVQAAIGATYIPEWNDEEGRTQVEVIEAFKRAEQLAREQSA